MTRHTGSCHCGAVAFEAEMELPEGAMVMECNCSHCARKGFLLKFIPKSAFRLTAEGPMTEYRFNQKAIAHLFCSACGVQSFGRGAAPDGSEMVAVNVRCLDGVDLSTLVRQPVDGKSF